MSSSNITSPDIINDARIGAFLDTLRVTDCNRFELVQALRQTILELDPGIGEEFKYGGILFASQQDFCGVFSYTKHVSLEFGEGATFPDTFNVLEGKGKLRRHIKLTSLEDIEHRHIRHYLVLALEKSRCGA